MSKLLNEIQAMQNPALGAALIWRFSCGYALQNDPHDGVPFPLAFVVLPVVLHERTRQEVTSTYVSSGARKFKEKFERKSDLLLALNQRAIDLRGLSLRSVRQALASGLITLIPKQGTFWPRSYATPPVNTKSVRELLAAAEKLGNWCRPLSIYEISGILRVEI